MSVPQPVRATRLDTSHFRSLSLTGDVMLNNFLTYINEMVRVLAPHHVLPGVTREALDSFSETLCPASPPSPCQRDQGMCPHREPRKTEEGDTKSTNSYPGEQGWISILSILRCTHPIQTTYMPDPAHSKKKTPNPNPVYMKERVNPSVFKHKGR